MGSNDARRSNSVERAEKKKLIRGFLSFRPATFSEAGELVMYPSTPAVYNWLKAIVNKVTSVRDNHKIALS